MTVAIVAFFFGVLVSGQEHPVLVGPYETWEECASVREFLDRREYETDICAVLPLPQESQRLQVGDVPQPDKEIRHD